MESQLSQIQGFLKAWDGHRQKVCHRVHGYLSV